MKKASLSGDNIRGDASHLIPDPNVHNYEEKFPEEYARCMETRKRMSEITLTAGELIELLQKVPSDDPVFVYVFSPGKPTRDTCCIGTNSIRRNHFDGEVSIMVDL